MSDLEYITRPSGFIPLRVPGRLKEKKANEDEIIISFGSPGASIFNYQGWAMSIESEDEQEVRRTYDVVRVKNPDDNEQHVDVEVMTEYQARNTISSKRTTLRFADTQDADNIEILKRNQTRTND